MLLLLCIFLQYFSSFCCGLNYSLQKILNFMVRKIFVVVAVVAVILILTFNNYVSFFF